MAKKTKGKKGKFQKVVTIIKARGEPDQVTVQRGTEKEKPEQKISARRMPKPIRISPKAPRITPRIKLI